LRAKKGEGDGQTAHAVGADAHRLHCVQPAPANGVPRQASARRERNWQEQSKETTAFALRRPCWGRYPGWRIDRRLGPQPCARQSLVSCPL